MRGGTETRQTRQGHQRFNIDGVADGPGGETQEIIQVGMLRCLHQAEMPIRQRQRCIAAQAAEHRPARLRGRLDEQLRVPGAPDAVVDDSRDIDARPEGGESVDDGASRGRHRAGVDHEHHGPPRGPRNVGRRAFVHGGAVEEPHHPFGDDEVRIRRRRRDHGRDRRAAHGPRVEVEA